ncbi:MAG: hypothetical protein DHS80DRAFT_32634 [Piptocephalis tieghemiana]|nr:MAG: hypothetical protein DHS80DRAFT_32634 [Piptocephalis tieghemiana]
MHLSLLPLATLLLAISSPTPADALPAPSFHPHRQHVLMRRDAVPMAKLTPPIAHIPAKPAPASKKEEEEEEDDDADIVVPLNVVPPSVPDEDDVKDSTPPPTNPITPSQRTAPGLVTSTVSSTESSASSSPDSPGLTGPVVATQARASPSPALGAPGPSAPPQEAQTSIVSAKKEKKKHWWNRKPKEKGVTDGSGEEGNAPAKKHGKVGTYVREQWKTHPWRVIGVGATAPALVLAPVALSAMGVGAMVHGSALAFTGISAATAGATGAGSAYLSKAWYKNKMNATNAANSESSPSDSQSTATTALPVEKSNNA